MILLSVIEPLATHLSKVLAAPDINVLVRRTGGAALGAAALALSLADTAAAQTIAAQTIAAQTIDQARTQAGSRPLAASQLLAQAESTDAVPPPPAPSPEPTPFTPSAAGIVDLSAGSAPVNSVGHLRPQDIDRLSADDVGWLERVILPLYGSPGGEHWGWIYEGWLIPKGQAYLAIGRDAGFAMVRAYENLYTFPVLEVREDGWFQVQYTPGGSAWAHVSQLELGAVALVLEGWESRLQAQESVYFLETGTTQPLRSQPEMATNMLSLVAADSLIEPLEFEGNWMRVRVTRPTALCRPLTGATVTEGWMRWRADSGESLIWYGPGGGCASQEAARGRSLVLDRSKDNAG